MRRELARYAKTGKVTHENGKYYFEHHKGGCAVISVDNVCWTVGYISVILKIELNGGCEYYTLSLYEEIDTDSLVKFILNQVEARRSSHVA